ncbi:hypothetical protein Mp_Vg00260 [Marchantia polymorpha subsp. ruderalis]|uniref:Uncharacterized protein n=1 Tax=Marchantia polymorpha TaxID=3197 RepID=A0A2R6VWU4_MARPO|nr:hypothetical protein MARPO_YB0026 [Marchantia polymorpha]BBN20476.1 hypothetical protein Mp_Vg00260 [Marchantia polymorpha subsp. ruderalis]|eukprot:PTQ26079.1 hypothetical protein MARPO_YB0026 [Marchantia polymorpha]
MEKVQVMRFADYFTLHQVEASYALKHENSTFDKLTAEEKGEKHTACARYLITSLRLGSYLRVLSLQFSQTLDTQASRIRIEKEIHLSRVTTKGACLRLVAKKVRLNTETKTDVIHKPIIGHTGLEDKNREGKFTNPKSPQTAHVLDT